MWEQDFSAGQHNSSDLAHLSGKTSLTGHEQGVGEDKISKHINKLYEQQAHDLSPSDFVQNKILTEKRRPLGNSGPLDAFKPH